MKLIRKIAFTIIIVVVAFLLLQQLNFFPNFGKWFKSKPLLIENTPLIIESIKDLKQIISITSQDEVAIQKRKNIDGSLIGNILTNGPFNPNDKTLGIIAKGTLYAGIDLQNLTEKDINVNKDSVIISLPAATILEAVINPSDVEIVSEQGHWDMQEVNATKAEAKQKMIDKAKDQGIITKAETRGRLLIENFLRSIGFKKISIVITH